MENRLKRMPLNAIGMHALLQDMLARGLEITEKRIMEECGSGHVAVRNALHVLLSAGLLERERIRDKGRCTGIRYRIT